MKWWPCILMALMLCAGCKPSVPNKYIQPDDMADMLYDYHLALAVAQGDYGNGDDTLQSRVTKLAVLRKYAVSEADFDSSMVYYMRHSERMQKIYESITDRLNDEAQAQGLTGSDANRYSFSTNSTDTVNIWRGNMAVTLSQYAPFNLSSFEITADTTFHRGDVLLLNFHSQYLYQDGSHDGVAVLSVVLGNDSVTQQVVRISSSTDYAAQLKDDKHLGIKRVRGYFLQNTNTYDGSQSKTTMKMMFISGIRLIKMHEDKKAVEQQQRTDSIRRSQDSISHGSSQGRRNMPLPQQSVRAVPPPMMRQ